MFRSDFGNSQPVRYLPPDCATLFNGDGEEMLCKCGKKATNFVASKTCYLARCTECANMGRVCKNNILD